MSYKAMKTEQQIIDEEVRKEIYAAANEYATEQVDPRNVSKHHFVSGAVWVLGNKLVQNFIDQEKPADFDSITCERIKLIKERNEMFEVLENLCKYFFSKHIMGTGGVGAGYIEKALSLIKQKDND